MESLDNPFLKVGKGMVVGRAFQMRYKDLTIDNPVSLCQHV